MSSISSQSKSSEPAWRRGSTRWPSRPTSSYLARRAHGRAPRRVRGPGRRYAAHALSGRCSGRSQSCPRRLGRVRARGPSQKPPLAAAPRLFTRQGGVLLRQWRRRHPCVRSGVVHLTPPKWPTPAVTPTSRPKPRGVSSAIDGDALRWSGLVRRGSPRIAQGAECGLPRSLAYRQAHFDCA